MEKYCIGFDLGGTKMIAGLVDSGKKVLNRVKRKSPGTAGAKAVVEEILSTLNELLEVSGIPLSQVATIGMAVPGVLDRKKGRVMQTPNLGFYDFPLVEKIRSAFDVPIFLENDVNAGVYGEFVAGAAKGYQHVLGVFPGTGIGGGLILNGQLYAGAGGNAGEIGHMVLQLDGPLCGCGQYGHIEAIASRSAMARDAVSLIAGGRVHESLLAYGTDIRNISSKFFAEGLKLGDPQVIGIIDRAARQLGQSLAGSVNLLNPECVVIGGGLIEKLGSYYLEKIEASLKASAMAFIAKDVTMKAAELGDNAAIIGSAVLAKEGLKAS